MSEQQVNEVKILEFDKLQMFTPCPGVEGKRSRLTWNMRMGYPRITVFTNDPNDTTMKGVIYAAMDPTTMFAFFDLMGKVIKSQDELKFKIDCFTTKYVDNQPTSDRVLSSELWFGRDKDGIIWMSVIAPGRPKIRFNFRISDYHGIYRGDGTPINESESSVIAAAASIAVLRTVFGGMLTRVFENPPPRPQRLGTYEKKPVIPRNTNVEITMGDGDIDIDKLPF